MDGFFQTGSECLLRFDSTFSFKWFLSNLDRESLRLLGLRDLDLDRDLPPPLPSSYSLILTIHPHSHHSPHYNLILINNMLMSFWSFMRITQATFFHPAQLHQACQGHTPCRSCSQIPQPLRHSCRRNWFWLWPDRFRCWSTLNFWKDRSRCCLWPTCCHGSWCRSPPLPASCSPSGPAKQNLGGHMQKSQL